MITEQDARDCLPPIGYVRDSVIYGLHMTDAPGVFHFAGALCALAAVVPGDLVLPAFGTLTPATLCVLVVGPSGCRKSHTIKMQTQPLRALADERVSDATSSYEGLFGAVQQRPRQLLVHSEFGAFLAHTSRGYAQPVRELYIQLADCDPVEQRLVKSKKKIPNPRVSILGACTPTLLSAHTDHVAWQGGLMGRFIILYSNRSHFYDSARGDSRYHGRLVEMLSQRMETPIGRCGGLSTASMAIWKPWSEGLDDRWQKDARVYAASAAVRTPMVALRIALLYGFDYGDASEVGPNGTWYIEPDQLEPAIRLAELHLKSAIELCDMITPTTYSRQRQHAYMTLQDAGQPLRRGEIMARMTEKVDVRTAARVLQALVEESVVHEVTVGGETWFSTVPFAPADDLSNVVAFPVGPEEGEPFHGEPTPVVPEG